MGASFNTMKAEGTEVEVKTKFMLAQNQDRHDNGHSYSGGFGMASGLEFPGFVAPSEKEAETWLEANCQKWEAALAVRIGMREDQAWLIGAWCAS